MFGSGGDDYELRARFLNAGQVVKGGLVEIAGRQVGTVSELDLADDGTAELTLKIDEGWAPIPRGTTAEVRQFGLSGPASRYIELRYPQKRNRGDLPDGATLSLDSTTANVELDEIFALFNKRTRKSLKGVFRGSAEQYAGEGENARAGLLYLDPAIVSASRLFEELNRDEPKLERFLNENSKLVGDISERRDDLAELVRNLAETTGAIARPPNALGTAIRRLPPFMRQANTTYVNLRSTLDELDPLVREAKPVAKRLRPYTAELRGLVRDLEPTVRNAANLIRKRGRSNDLVELARATPPVRDIAIGPVKRNGQEREGALPATAEALKGATPRLAFARPYSPDFIGWLDDFSHSGNYDALGGTSRIGTHVNAFSFKGGVLSPISPTLRGESLRALATLGQTSRCPGSAERNPGDGSTPYRPHPEFNCDPRQVPPGR